MIEIPATTNHVHGLEPEIEALLSDFPSIIEIPVAWGEQDAFGHVNNIVYIRQFESARIQYMLDCEQREAMKGVGIGVILASISCRYKLPITFPDTVIVGARVTQIGSDRFTMTHRTVSRRHKRIAAEGEGVIVTYDYTKLAKAPVPQSLREGILAFEAGTFEAGTFKGTNP